MRASHLSSANTCGTDVVIIKGRVEHTPPSTIIHVHLIDAKQAFGESGEVTLEERKLRSPDSILDAKPG